MLGAGSVLQVVWQGHCRQGTVWMHTTVRALSCKNLNQTSSMMAWCLWYAAQRSVWTSLWLKCTSDAAANTVQVQAAAGYTRAAVAAPAAAVSTQHALCWQQAELS
jgi:hypothetical protein